MLPVEHCMKGTKGWEIIPELKEWTHQAIMVEKPTLGSVKITSTYISESTRTNRSCRCFCSDICVISNALILKAYFPETPIIVYENACAGVTPDQTSGSH